MFADAGRAWDNDSVFAETIDVELDRLADMPLDLPESCSGSNAPRKIGNVGRIVPFRPFDYDTVSHHFLPNS